MSDIKKILDTFPSYCKIIHTKCVSNYSDGYGSVPKRASIVLSVGKTGWGFGELTLVQDSDGQLAINTEGASLEIITEIFTNWIKSAITDWDEDLVKHKKYNEVIDIECDEYCWICIKKDIK